MDEQSQVSQPKGGLDILVGIEAGVLGGAVMLAWFVLISPLLGEPWWLIPNRFASALYSNSVRGGFGMVTIAGAAVHLLCCGIAGAAHGLLTPGGRLFGLGLAAALYLLNYLLLWKKVAPAVLYAPQPLLIAGYYFFGSALGQHSNLLARARR